MIDHPYGKIMNQKGLHDQRTHKIGPLRKPYHCDEIGKFLTGETITDRTISVRMVKRNISISVKSFYSLYLILLYLFSSIGNVGAKGFGIIENYC